MPTPMRASLSPARSSTNETVMANRDLESLRLLLQGLNLKTGFGPQQTSQAGPEQNGIGEYQQPNLSVRCLVIHE